MSLIGHIGHDLDAYETEEQLEGLVGSIEDDLSTLRGWKRGAEEKLNALREAREEEEEEGDD